MTLIESIRAFFLEKRGAPVHLRDLYARLPERKEHSLRARIYERLGKEFRRIGEGLYVAIDGPAACVVVQSDAWEALPLLPSESVDAVITDPPYPWLDCFVGKGTTRPRMKWGYEKREIDSQLALELWRIMKKGAHAFLFVPAETRTTRPFVERMIRLLENSGFVFQKRFIWDKMKLGLGYSGRNRYEGILFLSKGEKRQPCDRSIPDVLDHPAPEPRSRRHKSEKPVWLLEQLVKFSTRAGELVLDCFAGSLATGRAALGLGRDSIMIEKDAEILAAALAV
jgi:DNA modification methylase